MARRNLILGILILFLAAAGLWLKAYRDLPAEPDTILLKDNTQIKGAIVKQDFGKYLIIEKADRSRQVIIWDQVKDVQLYQTPWYLRVDDALEGILRFGVIGGFLVFGIGLWQYAESQKWKRAEFLLKEVRAFEPNQNVVNVRKMLDSNSASIYLYGKDEKPVTVDRAILEEAVSDSEKQKKQNEHVPAIQHALDAYLSHLDHFNNIVDSGLVRKKELKLYIEYWLDIIGNTKNQKLSPDLRRALWAYMQRKGFKGATQLLKKYGYAIPDLITPTQITRNKKGNPQHNVES